MPWGIYQVMSTLERLAQIAATPHHHAETHSKIYPIDQAGTNSNMLWPNGQMQEVTKDQRPTLQA
jgi:hypothetical protein